MEKAQIDFTDIIRAIDELNRLGPTREPDTFTSRDFGEVIGLSDAPTRRLLRKLIEAGKVQGGVRVLIKTVHGDDQHVRGYRLVRDEAA